MSRKRVVSFILVMCLMTTIFIAGNSTATFAETPIYLWTSNSLESIFKDSNVPAKPDTNISMVAARNEYESAQIVLKAAKSFKINSVVFSDLICGGGKINKSSIRYNFVDFVKVTKGTGTTNPVRSIPAYFPEYLLNDASKAVSANTAQPILVTVYIPKSTKAGSYEGTVNVNTDKGNLKVRMQLEVADVTIPDSVDSSYSISNWSWTSGWEDFPDQIKIQYGYDRYTPEWWALMGKFAENMKEDRINQQWIQAIGLLYDGGSTVDKDGTVHFKWSRFDELISFFMAKGATKRLESGHLLLKEGGTYAVWGLKRNSSGKTVMAKMKFNPADTNSEAVSFARQYIKALGAHLKDKRWFDKWYLSIGDEPSVGDMTDKWIAAYDLVQKYAPGMKVLNAFFDQNIAATAFEGRVKLWVPLLSILELNKNYYKSKQALGDEVYDYVCGGPSGQYLNRLIDMPLARNRLMHWYNYKQGITGALHWAWNFWHDGINTGAPGDAAIVYPDPANKTIKNTLRQVASRDGAEEYELFKILESKNPEFAKKLVGMVVASAQVYSENGNDINKAHDILVKAAAGQTVGYPEIDDLSNAKAKIVNAGFEDTTKQSSNSPWNWTWGGEIVKGNAHTGKWSGCVKGVEGGIEQVIRVKPNTSYKLSAYGKLGKIGIQNVYLSVRDYNMAVGKGELKAYYTSVKYEKKEIEFTTGENDYSAIIAFAKYPGGDGKVYVDDFSIKEISSAVLKSIKIDGKELAGFMPDQMNYTIDARRSVKQITVTPTAVDKAATVKVNGKVVTSGTASEVIKLVAEGDNKIEIEVKAADGTMSKTYTISIRNGYILNDNDKDISYTGAWGKSNRTGYYLGDYHSSNEGRAYSVIKFSGAQAKVYGAKNDWCGMADVYVDGVKKATIDNYSASNLLQQVYFDTGILPSGMHTIKIVVLHKKNQSSNEYYIDIDKVEVLT